MPGSPRSPDPDGSDPSALDGYPVEPPSVPPPVFTHQTWADLTFVHWPVEPSSVAHLFPTGTRPDVFADGMTYVALVPFVMKDAAYFVSRTTPYVGNFLETNVRLYSTDDAGRHGVFFRSLETERLGAVPAARTVLGVPYTWARMRMTRNGDRITYDSTRRLPRRGLRCHLTIDVGDVVEPTPLEVWLTSRWGAHTRKVGRTWWLPNAHGPFPLRAAEIVHLDDELVTAAGVTCAGEPLRAVYSTGVRARFGRPSVVTR